MKLYPHLGAFESTKIHGTGQDVLSTTRHVARWEDDLRLLQDAGIHHLRYSIPWHRIERRPGEFDWQWIDGPLRFMERYRMHPIVDPLHHTSFPDWLTDGFANQEFPQLYERFLSRFADRYPWVQQYTVFNEPLPTTLFCSYTGLWYPYRQSDQDFVRMATQVAKCICRSSAMLQQRNPQVQFVHIDTCEHHRALDARSEAWVEYANHRRFLLHDLILGRVNRRHPLYLYLRQNGFQEADRHWFQDHATVFHVLGLDYYFHSEIDWHWSDALQRADICFPCAKPRGFASVAHDYLNRFKVPVLLSETNIRGTVTDRLTWLKLMEEQCEMLVHHGVDFRGFCWYPSIDSTDWCHCCAQCTKSVDPQGIWLLDQHRWDRRASELSEVYSSLARGHITARDIPSYRMLPPVDRDLQGWMPFMEHWPHWREPAQIAEQVA